MFVGAWPHRRNFQHRKRKTRAEGVRSISCADSVFFCRVRGGRQSLGFREVGRRDVERLGESLFSGVFLMRASVIVILNSFLSSFAQTQGIVIVGKLSHSFHRVYLR